MIMQTQGTPDYKPSPDVPYICSTCNIRGIKLWRMRGNHYESAQLQCAHCATVQEGLIGISIDPKTGKHFNKRMGVETDAIGRKVPALPGQRGKNFLWIPTNSEQALDYHFARLWWESLPLVRR